MKNIFSFDAETDGLWGQPFAISAIVYKNGIETSRFLSRLPNSFVTNEWVIENVLPAMENIAVTHSNYETMLRDFAAFYMSNTTDTDIICHMGFPVEAHLLREMHRIGAIGDWDGPYPLIDLAGNLKQAGGNPTSVDEYATKFGLEIPDFGTTHNPLYDCAVAAHVYMHLMK
mgnify:CR=1 FL=1